MISLSSAKIEEILLETTADFPHDYCLTCECFLGLVMQLKIDSEPAAQPLLEFYKVQRKDMHACLGCNPCPPGNRYANYIKHKTTEKIITL